MYVHIRRFYSAYNKFTQQISTTYHSHLALQLVRQWLPLHLHCAGSQCIMCVKACAGPRCITCVKACAGPRSITCVKACALVSNSGPSHDTTQLMSVPFLTIIISISAVQKRLHITYVVILITRVTNIS